MKKNQIVSFLAAGLFLAAPLCAESPGKAGFSFLKITPFARSAGMAEATSGFIGDSLVIYSNPAGLAHLPAGEVSLQQISHFDDVTFSNLAFANTYKRGGWGFDLGVLSVDGITRTKYDSSSVDRYVESGSVDAGNYLGVFSWGRRQTTNLALGMNLKMVQEKLDSETAFAAMGDLGGIYRVDRRWRAALVLQNFGTSGKFVSESVAPPTRVKAGAYWSPENWAQWEADLVYNMDGDPELLLGGELNWEQIGFFRMGYRYSFRPTDLGVEAGAAIGAGVQWNAFRADYAFLPYGDLGVSHRFSLAWRFAPLKSIKS